MRVLPLFMFLALLGLSGQQLLSQPVGCYRWTENRPDTIWTYEQVDSILSGWNTSNSFLRPLYEAARCTTQAKVQAFYKKYLPERVVQLLLYMEVQRVRKDSLGLPYQMFHTGLAEAAQHHTNWMGFHGLLGHVEERNGYFYSFCDRVYQYTGSTNCYGGEICVGGNNTYPSYSGYCISYIVKYMVEAWWNSPGHKAIMTDNLLYCGYAISIRLGTETRSAAYPVFLTNYGCGLVR